MIKSIKRVIKKMFSISGISLPRIQKELQGILFSNNINKLAQLYKSDKWGRHYYTPHYQDHFRKYRYRSINLLEIGVGGYKNPNKGGNSLRMWKKYFPFGKIYSIDLYEKKGLEEKRIKILQGSQVDRDFLERLVKEIGKLDIIIDDGSHNNEHVKLSFEILFPLLSNNGIYVIEDTETSYLDSYGGDSLNLDNPRTTLNFLKTFPDKINFLEYRIPNITPNGMESQISSIHFYHNLVFIHKKENTEKSSNFSKGP